ncbi:MAG: chromate transporter [Armatimonadetes bacterium]|nr:chromate transporter [Armatimonadota bacterium]MDI9582829.1 chromate transporter [Acidobacteriota bacterium]
MRLTTLAAKFLRIGATGFGGPMALVGLMQHQLVEKSGDVSEADFAEGVAIGQVLPGPVAVDCATHIGHRLRGLPGAVVSTVALILPAFLLMLVLTPLYLAHGKVPQVAGFFLGVGPAVLAIILATAWRMGAKNVTDRTGLLIAVAAGASTIAGANPAIVILAAGLAGLIIYRPRHEEDQP